MCPSKFLSYPREITELDLLLEVKRKASIYFLFFLLFGFFWIMYIGTEVLKAVGLIINII